MPKPYIEALAHKMTFYRDQYRAMLKLSIILLILNLLAIAWIFFDLFTEPETKYFITTTSGQVESLIPRD